MAAVHPSATRKVLEPSRLWRLGKELAWITVGNAAAMLGSLVGIRVLTTFLSPSDYGQVALGVTLATFVNQTVMGPLSNGASRFYAPAVEAGDLREYWQVVRRLIIRATIGTSMLVIPISVALVYLGKSGALVLAAAATAYAIVAGCNATLSGMQGAARQRSIVALHQGVEPWARFLFAAALAVLVGATSTEVMLGYALAAVLVLGSQYLFFRRVLVATLRSGQPPPARAGDWQANIWKYSWPFALWGIFGWAQQSSDRWALGLFASTSEVGLYAVLFQLGYYPISIATGVAMQLIAPIFYARAGDGTDPRRNAGVTRLSVRVAAFSLFSTGLAFLLGIALHPQIFRLVAAPEYERVSYLLPWMLLAGGLFASGQIISLDLMSQMRTQQLMVAKIMTSLIGMVLNIVGAYFYGIAGIVASLVLFSVLYLAWMLVLARQAPLPEGAR